MRAHVGLYPLPVHGHHPNFQGAPEAAEGLLEQLVLRGLVASTRPVLCFPDYVLRPLRRGLLERGSDVVVPAKYGRGYRLLESGRHEPAKAATIAGAERLGHRLETLPAVDVALVACVALTPSGDYLRKGYGYRLPAEAATVPAATIVHPLQLVPELPGRDGSVTLYATPENVFETR